MTQSNFFEIVIRTTEDFGVLRILSVAFEFEASFMKLCYEINPVARIFSEELWAVTLGGGLYGGGTLQHWYFSALGIFSTFWIRVLIFHPL